MYKKFITILPPADFPAVKHSLCVKPGCQLTTTKFY